MEINYMQSLVNFFTIITDLAIIMGIPIGLYQLTRTARKEQREREEQVYNALDEKYIDFVELCLQHPYLDVFDIPDNESAVLTTQQKKEELIVFTVLVSIMERAYIMYHDQNNKMKQI